MNPLEHCPTLAKVLGELPAATCRAVNEELSSLQHLVKAETWTDAERISSIWEKASEARAEFRRRAAGARECAEASRQRATRRVW